MLIANSVRLQSQQFWGDYVPLSPRQTVLRWSCGSVVASTVFIYRRCRWTCVLETPEMIGACHNIASKLAKVNFSWTSSGPGLGWFPLHVKMSHLCPLAKQCSGGRAGPIEHPYDSPTWVLGGHVFHIGWKRARWALLCSKVGPSCLIAHLCPLTNPCCGGYVGPLSHPQYSFIVDPGGHVF